MSKEKWLFIFGIILALIIVLFLSYATGEGRGNINKNERTGERIINALYAYKQANGVFPNALNELVPDYLDKIPKTGGWQNFFYAIDPIDGFVLYFKVESRSYCGYTDKLKDWECSHYGGE